MTASPRDRQPTDPVREAPKPRLDPDSWLSVEIVSIGRELLRGVVADRNAPQLATRFTGQGARIERITIVNDSAKCIGQAVVDALDRGAQLVVTTGGLGPAADDGTLKAIAEFLQRPLTIQQAARDMVEQAYRRLRDSGQAREGLNAGREKMCELPIGSAPVANPVGVAPGMFLRLTGGAVVLCLPGSPDEVSGVLDEAWPRLKELLSHAFVAQREVETPTVDESSLGPLLERLADEFPGVWVKSLAPGFSDGAPVRVALEAGGSSRYEAEQTVESALRRLLDLARTR